MRYFYSQQLDIAAVHISWQCQPQPCLICREMHQCQPWVQACMNDYQPDAHPGDMKHNHQMQCLQLELK